MKVLIIDDSPDALAVAKARLAKEHLEVICADGGQAGLKAARDQKPDLILLDVNMPDISGFELCRQLKADVELQMIPVIFLTGSDTTEDRVKGLDIGAVDYVTKPFDAFELRARVRAALRTKHLQDLLTEHANIDPLTELPNRRALMKHLEKEWSRFQRHGDTLSFIMADIDHFKQVNDTYGHSIGDQLLRRIAQALAEQCRKTDLPARYGGEEFAIVVPHENMETALHLAQRCRQAIEHISMQVDQQQVKATASFGVAEALGLSNPEDLIQKADQALYQAKQYGRNRVESCTDKTQSAISTAQLTAETSEH